MKLKMICCGLTAALMALSVSAWDPFAILPASSQEVARSFDIPVTDGEVLELSAQDLELRFGIEAGDLAGVTITELPGEGDGVLILDDVEAELFDYLPRADLDRLCFIPYSGATSARFSLLPNVPASQDAVAASLHVKVLSEQRSAPVLEGFHLQTIQNVSASGYLNVTETDDSAVTFRLLKSPAKGKLTLSGAGFVYEPFYNLTGNDSFTVCAVDSVGNYSEPAVIQVGIESNKQGFQYADMLTHPSHYAAIKLQEAGVVSGWQVGGQSLFFPDRVLLRGDFVLWLVQSSGISVSPTVHSGLPNDSELPVWFKPYAKAAVEHGILPADKAFAYYEVPTRAEAVVLTGRASKISDVGRFRLWMPDAADIPDWAEGSYMSLAAYRMLDLYDGCALPGKALTNSYGADLAWQLYKHFHR